MMQQDGQQSEIKLSKISENDPNFRNEIETILEKHQINYFEEKDIDELCGLFLNKASKQTLSNFMSNHMCEECPIDFLKDLQDLLSLMKGVQIEIVKNNSTGEKQKVPTPFEIKEQKSLEEKNKMVPFKKDERLSVKFYEDKPNEKKKKIQC